MRLKTKLVLSATGLTFVSQFGSKGAGNDQFKVRA